MACNYDNRNCDKCGEFHYKGELRYHGFIPGKGHWFTCKKCDAATTAIKKNIQIKKEREALKASQPTLF